MAAITKRGQRWRVRIRRNGVYLTETFDTEDAAEIWAAEKEAELRLGADAARSKYIMQRKLHKHITFGDLLDKYAEEISPSKKSGAAEIGKIEALKKFDICDMSLKELGPHHFDKWIAYRLKVDKVSGSTVNRDLNLISHVFTVARKRWRYGIDNPITEIQRPKNNQSRERRLEKDEEARLLKACAGARNKWLTVIVTLAIHTACRRGELLNLDWRDIDLSRNTLRVRDSKSGKPRTVPLSTTAAATLEAWRNESSNEKGKVFPDTSTEALKLAYKRAVKRAEITNLTFHDLRHEGTSRFFEDHGLEIVEVMSATGHSNATMTERYTHLNAQRIAQKMGRGRRITLTLSDKLTKRINTLTDNAFDITERITLLIDEALTAREKKQCGNKQRAKQKPSNMRETSTDLTQKNKPSNLKTA